MVALGKGGNPPRVLVPCLPLDLCRANGLRPVALAFVSSHQQRFCDFGRGVELAVLSGHAFMQRSVAAVF